MYFFQRYLIVQWFISVLFVSMFSATSEAWVESAAVQQPHVSVSLVSEKPYLVAGENARFALKIVPDEGWHTYWKNPGDTGLASQLSWQLPKGFRAGELEWPVPERIDYQGATNYGYHEETWLFTSLSIPLTMDDERQLPVELTLNALAQWLVCKEICIPGSADLFLNVPVYPQALRKDNVQYAEPSEQQQSTFNERSLLLPSLIHSAQASYRIGDFLEISVPLKDLPLISHPPQVFLGKADVIDNSKSPVVEVVGDDLLIRANIDPYLEASPGLLPVLLTGLSSGSRSVPLAVEFVAREGELSSAVNALPNVISGKRLNAVTPSEQTTVSLLYALVLALMGGIILNAMPCVFPVLSLKILSLVESGNHSSLIRQQHGIAYAVGVISSFVLIAAVLIILRFFGEQIGWGFQLQSPWFVAFLVYLLFILGLSLSGFIELGGSLQNVGSSLNVDNNHWRGSFFTGVLATVVATPCTAPFMGTAMGFALSQSTVVALVIFAVMGFGLALPFVVIAFVPRLAALLPKPGQWMVTLKELLAFPIYLTVVWLLWVFSRQAGDDALPILLLGLVMLTMAAWLYRLQQKQTKSSFLWFFMFLSLILAAIAAVYAGSIQRSKVNDIGVTELFKPNHHETVNNTAIKRIGEAEVFNAQQLATALANGEAVFVNMTADWCITCKLNERIALSTDTVKKLFKTESVRYMKGDWTNSDAAITAYLAEFNRNGVPLYVYYAPDTPPDVLPQILTVGIIRNYIKPE